jgi:hypothetical protein
MSFQFLTKKGVHGIFNTYYSARGFSEDRLVILCRRGSIICEGNKISVRSEKKLLKRMSVNDDGGYMAEYEDFYRAIRRKGKVRSSFIQGYIDLNVIIQALNSEKKWGLLNF